MNTNRKRSEAARLLPKPLRDQTWRTRIYMCNPVEAPIGDLAKLRAIETILAREEEDRQASERNHPWT